MARLGPGTELAGARVAVAPEGEPAWVREIVRWYDVGRNVWCVAVRSQAGEETLAGLGGGYTTELLTQVQGHST